MHALVNKTTDLASCFRILDQNGVVQFTCRVIHSVPLAMSVVQVFYKDQMAVVSHLTNSNQLPTPTKVIFYSCFTLYGFYFIFSIAVPVH